MKSKSQKIREYMEKNPDATTAEIAKACKVTNQHVYQVRSDMGKRITKSIEKHMDNINAMNRDLVYQKRLGRPKLRMQASFDREPPAPEPVSVLRITTKEPKADPVNNPSHYNVGGMETIDFIEAKELGYHLGNVVKYVSRAKHKGTELEDLRKARWYLDRAISKLS